MSDSRARQLRLLIERPGPFLVPFAYDALSARVIENAGFEVFGISGSSLAAGLLAVPDVGLTTMTEVVTQSRLICNATTIPAIADVDTGYGGPLNVHRTICEMQQAGVAAVFMEDQITPKRCGHYERVNVIPAEEMVQKVRAAAEAKGDGDFLLIVRTDARASLGLDEAIERANRYVEAGADAIFVEAPRSVDELALLPRRIPVPLVANMVEGGKTPMLPLSELGALGYKIIFYPDTVITAAAWAMRRSLEILRREGITTSAMAELVSFSEMKDLLHLPAFEDMERRYVDRT